MALAVRVLPVPGLPYNSTPVGHGTMLRVPAIQGNGRLRDYCMSQMIGREEEGEGDREREVGGAEHEKPAGDGDMMMSVARLVGRTAQAPPLLSLLPSLTSSTIFEAYTSKALQPHKNSIGQVCTAGE